MIWSNRHRNWKNANSLFKRRFRGCRRRDKNSLLQLEVDFFVLQRYFCQNFWSNRLYNKKETKKYEFGSVKVKFKMKKTSLPASLRSKRFRLASEQRGPRKGSFGFDRARNETRAKKWKRLFYLRHFSRGLWLSVPRSSLIDRTETLATQANFRLTCVAQKRLCLSFLFNAFHISVYLCWRFFGRMKNKVRIVMKYIFMSFIVVWIQEPAGSHNPESATPILRPACNGVFTDQFIFSIILELFSSGENGCAVPYMCASLIR